MDTLKRKGEVDLISRSALLEAERFLSEKQDASGYPIGVTLVMSDGRKIKYNR